MHHVTRRTFLEGAARGAAGAALTALIDHSCAAADADPKDSALIDAHTHFYDPTRPEGVPWPGKDDKLLYRRVLPEDYQAVPQPREVTGTVVVEASPWVEDNQWLLDLAQKSPFIVGVVGNLTPGSEGFQELLGRFARDSIYRGIRIGHDRLLSGLEEKPFLDDLQNMADLDLALDLNGGPAMPDDVARLAKALPDLRLVINHAANLRYDGGKPDPAWLQGMQAAAAGERVFCKVSALVEGAAPAEGPVPRTTDFYRPLLNALWEIWGPERLIYASNWPVSERYAPLDAVQSITLDYFREKGREASENFGWRNSQTAYQWRTRT